MAGSQVARAAYTRSYTEAVFIQMGEDFSVEDIEESFREFRGLPQKLDLFSAPAAPVIVREEENRPQPRMDRNAERGMAVSVGRIRKDQAFDRGLKYILVGHNTIRGAAGASILNAELIMEIM